MNLQPLPPSSIPSRRRLLAAACAAAGAALLRPAEVRAGTFPAKGRPIRLIVPFPAGGTSDLRARQVAERMGRDEGWTVVVENRAGASGMIGAGHVARAAADGYTLLLGTIGLLAINPHVFATQAYDVLRDLQPITQFSRSVTVLFAHRKLGVESLGDLEARVRAGVSLAYGSTGNGTIGHMVGETYKRRAELDIVHVPYKGTAPAVRDFVGYQVPLLYETPSAVWEHVKAGTAVPLAVSSALRMPQLPAVPTFSESGYTDLVFDTWQGLLTVRGVPADVLAALHREATQALADPEVVRSHEDQVNVVVAGTPGEFERVIRSETEKWGRIVRETGVQTG
ncbi:MAG TPA: tripartite tricarboxylate transporter substrate-binding protein [Burkholderiaceae bacterium]|nr:tripartite tricarboxylate transporter substrate-binding protein [Burkholderiaceae bacterium]